MTLTVKQMIEEARKHVPEVTADEAKQKIDRGEVDVILDVREPGEWERSHIPGAVLIPRGLLEFQVDPTSPMAKQELAQDQNQRIVVHCAKGARSLLAAATLKKMGYENVSSMAGGFDDWAAKGHPTEQPMWKDSS